VLSKANPRPALDVARVAAAGYALVIVATPILLAAAAAMSDALEQLRATGDLAAITTPQMANGDFNQLVGLIEDEL